MGLSKWLFELNEKKTFGKIYWPPDDTVQKYIERKQDPEPLTWRVYEVKVKRYKATIEEARIYLKGILNHDTNYETETKFGRGFRKRRAKKLELDSEDDHINKKRPVMKSSKPIPAPPGISFVPPVQHLSGKSERKVTVVSKGAIQRHAANVANKERVGSSSRKELKQRLEAQRNEEVTPSPLVAKVTLDKKKTPVSLDKLESKIQAVKSKSNNTEKVFKPTVPLPMTSKTVKLVNKRTGCNTNATAAEKLRAKVDSLMPEPSHNPPPSPTISPKTPVSADVTPSNSAANMTPVRTDVAPSNNALINENQYQAELGSTKSYSPEPLRSAVKKTQIHSELSISIPLLQSNSTVSSRKQLNATLHSTESNFNDQESEGSDVSSIFSCDLSDLSNNENSYENTMTYQDSKDSNDDSSCAESVSNEVSSNQTGGRDSAYLSDPESYNPIVDEIPTRAPSRGNIQIDTPDSMEGDIAAIRNEITFLRSDVQEANLNIARLLRYIMPHEKKVRTPPNMPTLPIQSSEAFDRFEQFLSDKMNFDAVVEYLSLLPIGTKEKQASMNLMSKVMANKLGSIYNFDGKTWKLAFKETKMWQAVEGALAKHFEQSTLEEAICGIRSWLRNAPKREGGLPSSAFLKSTKKRHPLSVFR